ncbi:MULTISPECIES: SDR family NAD(P)-dependent oxidoreductase [Rhodococcus]|uniref:SDR family NAD(P)-dependent oxidoreductase n=1 Tax=Rhodococcus TaxID=1827 RepID=UPI00120C6323|nr:MULTISPECIES: glucose 1-dehydrogenase [Rhodococcus]QXW01340.1 glucose 1-dehydrogenase [Rhodococcus globerulus]RZL24651.1 MAG: glucose 1-dehydrogenase [Rhodococcus sp. (in: high G+C Gram-positive bacteria)]
MNRLQGKVAIITGAGQGIGRAIADGFAREGAITIATGRSMSDTSSEQTFSRRLDVACEEDWACVVDEAIRTHGRIDVLVNNAGIIAYEALHELTRDAWEEVVATNQTGTWLGMRAVVPHMIEQGGGSIVNVSSIWGSAAVAGAHAYHATKGAVRNMSKSAAISYAENNIRVNSVHPGFVETPLTEAQAAPVNEFVLSRTPMGRAGTPEEIAHGVVFLASDESSFMTGSELVIDGGYLAQ